jgi:hypothetical protein
MLDYKVSTNILVPVVLTVTATGLPHTGVLAASVSVTIVKNDGATIATYTPTGQWTEMTSGAFTGSGFYLLTIPLAYTDQAGILNYAVAVTADDIYFGTVGLVANLVSDIYSKVTDILGLVYANSVLDQQTYNGAGKLTGGRLRTYDTSANALAAGVTGLLKTWTVYATYDGSNNETLFRITG